MWYSELFAMLVLRFGLDPEYVLDRMAINHLNILLTYSHYSLMDMAEQVRLLNLVHVQMYSRKKLKPSDLYQLPWDAKPKQTSKADRERLIKQAQNIENELNNTNG